MGTSRIDFAAGEVIFREGDPPTTAFLVESGEIQVSTHQGSEQIVLGQLGPGDLLGEMAVIDASPRTATAKALTACALIPVGREQIHERLQEADPIVRALVRGQLARYRAALATFRGEEADHRHNGDAGDGTVFEPGAADKIRLETQLRDALDRRALEVRYQPIYEIAHGEVRGYEALIRWEHPTRGAVSPAEFIALAEETSLIVPVGRYVFEEVCSALGQLHVRGISPLPFVAVNVSGRQLETASILDEMRVIANLRGVPVDAIKVEITESLTLDVDRVGELIEKCHAAGVKVALDDFGTGYSNLGHLHKLQFDTVKLDQGFVRQMLHAPRCYAIVKAIVDLVNALDADMVAEGVETEAQIEALREMGCRYAQGYLIGRPMDRAAMIAAQLGT